MLITENLLDEWTRGNSDEARGVVVDLIYRLVAASCPKPRERRFPLSDSIGQHGADGVLDTLVGFDPFVPDGLSYWEVGAGLDAGRKATDDYKGLTEAVAQDVRAHATFIFVTPLSGIKGWEYTWKKDQQAEWLDTRLKKKEWQDVRVIDGTRLIDWLSYFPSVELWLASRIGSIPPGQIETPTKHWEILSSIPDPLRLTPDLFLANRSDAVAKLQNIFDGTTNQLKLGTRHAEQAVDFVAACLASLDEAKRLDATGRCLIVSSADAWNAICDNPHIKNHILVADSKLYLGGDVGAKLIQKARWAGHSVTFGGPQGGMQDLTTAALPSPQLHQIQEALKKAGYAEERSRSLAYKSGGNLSSLLALIQNVPVLPAWAERSEASALAIAVLLGSWTDGLQADQDAVEKVSGKAYGEWIREMREIVVSTATPLVQHDGLWKFIPRYEGWYSLGQNIFDEHLECLRSVSIAVLGEIDPKFELSADERFVARIHGKVLSHSPALRSGLAEALALLGSHPGALTSCSLGKAQAIATLAAREILDTADWMRWASVDDMLPLLAEAAPGEFLNAVERALHVTPCPFDELFAQEGDVLIGGIYHTGLLWALETLAWDPACLSRAVVCLGELAARDPGGRTSNRPANSITAIFLPWFPQTCAPVSKRIAAVKVLLTELHGVGWNLLLSLMPDQHSWSSGSRRPAWRTTLPEDWRDGSTAQEYWDQVFAYGELAVECAKADTRKLGVLVDHLDHLYGPAHDNLLEYLEADSMLSLSAEERLIVWTKLTDLVSKHRRFPDAKWVMPAEDVSKIAAIASKLQPEAPYYLHQRLFAEHDAHLFEENGDYLHQTQELDKRRQAAIAEVAEAGGLKSVLDFAQAVQSAWRAGFAFGCVAGPDTDEKLLPSLLESKTQSLLKFVSGFVRGRFHTRGWDWVDGLHAKGWTQAQVGKLLCLLPFAHETWERAKTLLGADQSAYWRDTPANPYEADANLEIAIDQLLTYKRPLPAIGCLHRLLIDGKKISSKQAIMALLEALKTPEQQSVMDTYEAAEVIKATQSDSSADPDGLFRVEWAYLPLLDGEHGTTPRLLWRRLAEEPSFFCEMIRLVFRSKNADRKEEEVTEARRKIATNAYRLLSGWKRPPGYRDVGEYDGDALRKWLEDVRSDSFASGHLDMAMEKFGHVLIYVPADPDGLWIHKAAAEVLNARDADRIRIGFELEMLNSRGVHWVDPTGKPEYELAAKYSAQAEAVEVVGYPRLAVTLRSLAHSYDQEAERNKSRDALDE